MSSGVLWTPIGGSTQIDHTRALVASNVDKALPPFANESAPVTACGEDVVVDASKDISDDPNAIKAGLRRHLQATALSAWTFAKKLLCRRSNCSAPRHGMLQVPLGLR